ncbi:protein of unknown function-containing protein [Forsythia ovata]|uniref:DUF569 domain-containing protein n=1 Tax=Forsythia ovata TaxID=205694 RepID=A0ABD1X5Q2_9LAMI
MHQEDEALVGRQTTPRQDDNTISDTDHESSREMKGYNNGKEVEKNASTTEHGQAEGRYHFLTVSGMEIFKRANTVRLKSRHNKYLTADSNEESVIQDRFGSSKSVYWTVEFVQGVESVLRLKSCYGKYLTASDETFLLGMTGQKVVQTMPRKLDECVEWEPIIDGIMQVKLKARYGNFLRANGGIPPWRNSVTHDIPYTHHEWILWEVDIIETRPDSPPKVPRSDPSGGDLGSANSFHLPSSNFNRFGSFDESPKKSEGQNVVPSTFGDEEHLEENEPLIHTNSHAQVSQPRGPNSNGDLIFDFLGEPGYGGPIPGSPDERPPEPGCVEHAGSKSLEILKSTVYGGLVESITSLSIVSSAAASETATMNIVALGLANVISGVFVVAHNLRDMKNECPETDSNEQTDRYQELIGRREHFLLHFTFAILSFLVFGLIPPAVYGLAFEKTGNNKDYTIIAVAAASLICIILLSIGKAYCKGEQRFSEYFKTILYYVSNAVAVSGVAYGMGDAIKILVKKLGWFETSTPTPATLFNSGINSATPFMASA